jgi:hypothetical protein
MLKLNLISPDRFQRALLRHAESAYDRWLVSHSNPVDMLAIELVRPIRIRKNQQLRVEKHREIEKANKGKEEQARNASYDRGHRDVTDGHRSLKPLMCPRGKRSRAGRDLAVAVHRLKQTQAKYKK